MMNLKKLCGTGDILDIVPETYAVEGYYAEYDQKEHDNKLYANRTAKDIYEFKNKVLENGGYYLARYEASKGEDGKVKSKSAPVWNHIKQIDASKVSQAMYENQNFTSDLINSYAWDIAIVFIQTYSGDNDYSKEVGKTFGNDCVNTGTTTDKRCNIYDMASNCLEWTTETSTYMQGDCTIRGGTAKSTFYYTSIRSFNSTIFDFYNVSFRPLLYLK